MVVVSAPEQLYSLDTSTLAGANHCPMLRHSTQRLDTGGEGATDSLREPDRWAVLQMHADWTLTRYAIITTVIQGGACAGSCVVGA